jgi:hypothetical protein
MINCFFAVPKLAKPAHNFQVSLLLFSMMKKGAKKSRQWIFGLKFNSLCTHTQTRRLFLLEPLSPFGSSKRRSSNMGALLSLTQFNFLTPKSPMPKGVSYTNSYHICAKVN